MLGKVRHDHSELPNDFPETFFRHEGKRADDKLSPDQLQGKIDPLKAQQAALEKKRDARLTKQEKDVKAKAQLEQRQEELDAKRKDRAMLDAGIKKMEDDLKKSCLLRKLPRRRSATAGRTKARAPQRNPKARAPQRKKSNPKTKCATAGLLCRGFARIRCESYDESRLVTFC